MKLEAGVDGGTEDEGEIVANFIHEDDQVTSTDLFTVIHSHLFQGVYNSWKYWKSPGILLMLLEKVHN